MANISFYGSHNAAVAVEDGGKIIVVIEIERFLSKKNSGYAQYLTCNTRPFLLKEVLNFIRLEYGIEEYDNCYYQNSDTIEECGKHYYEKLIPAKTYWSCEHHASHAACALYQSDYSEALIVSFDGGGNDGFFNIYHAPNRKEINLIKKIDLDLGFPYMIFGHYLEDIHFEAALSIGALVYSGKLMGLCSYGNVVDEWLKSFEEFYEEKPDGSTYLAAISTLSDKINVKFDTEARIKGQAAWDIAKTSQKAFENIFTRTIQQSLSDYPDIPLLITGGCALNILLNTELKQSLKATTPSVYDINSVWGRGREVFIPPNPNDCGIAAGMILNHIKPDKAIDLTYSGVPILDKHTLMSCVEHRCGSKLDQDALVEHLNDGKIIGVVRGNSEHGPRALGNRSILCNPSVVGMKDTLNEKVKNREWYRPFAPVCLLEDVSTYFEFEDESRWMSFCPKVKEEWRDKLVSITHADNTARVQTVTQDQNPWLYNLLTGFKCQSGVGVLLNTSFNVNGKPILSTYSEAFEVFDNTDMDCLVLGDYFFTK